MVWRKLGITDMALPNLLGLTLKHDEWEIRSDIIAQLVFHKQVLLLDVLTRVTIGNMRHNLYVAITVLTLLITFLIDFRIECSNETNLLWHFFFIFYKYSWAFVDYKLYVCGKKTINKMIPKNIKKLSVKKLSCPVTVTVAQWYNTWHLFVRSRVRIQSTARLKNNLGYDWWRLDERTSKLFGSSFNFKLVSYC